MAKKESISIRAFRYILSSAGKGASETFGIFMRVRKNKASFIHQQKQETEENKDVEAPKKGRIKNSPDFNDFKIEKVVSGNYNNFTKHLNEDSKIVLIFARRGSGKSALGLRIMENIKAKTNRNCYTLGINEKLLPNWIETISNVEEASQNSIIVVDEGAVSFSSRSSMTEANRELSKLMAIARHKNLTLIFITQNTGMIDKNVLKLADSLMIKEGILLQLEMGSKIKEYAACNQHHHESQPA